MDNIERISAKNIATNYPRASLIKELLCFDTYRAIRREASREQISIVFEYYHNDAQTSPGRTAGRTIASTKRCAQNSCKAPGHPCANSLTLHGVTAALLLAKRATTADRQRQRPCSNNTTHVPISFPLHYSALPRTSTACCCLW